MARNSDRSQGQGPPADPLGGPQGPRPWDKAASGDGSSGGSSPSGPPPLRPPIGAKNPLTGQPLTYDPIAVPGQAPPQSPPSPAASPAPPPRQEAAPAEGAAPVEVPVQEAPAPDGEAVEAADEAVEEAEQAVLDDLSKLAAERDDYLAQLQHTKADFENYRKRVLRQQAEHVERAAEGLAEKLLPVLDNFEAALVHGEGFEQVHASLVSTLEKEGLERIDPSGKPFDPSEADAVAHEEGDDGPVVAEVLRAGYRWKGRVLRPAMVRVRG